MFSSLRYFSDSGLPCYRYFVPKGTSRKSSAIWGSTNISSLRDSFAIADYNDSITKNFMDLQIAYCPDDVSSLKGLVVCDRYRALPIFRRYATCRTAVPRVDD